MQTAGQFSLTTSVADIEAVKAATTTSTKGKRIVREDMGFISEGNVGRRLACLC